MASSARWLGDFYTRLNQILDEHDFDGYVEGLCQRFYADDGRPGCRRGATIHHVVSARDASMPIRNLKTVAQQLDDTLSAERLIASLSTMMA